MKREQRTVFGEVADLYERVRPEYPRAVFDEVFAFGELSTGDRAVEIGAGTGKATRAMLARGLDVTALEPSAEMARILRASTEASVVATTFEAWTPDHDGFRLCFAAQAWHWVDAADRADRVAGVLEPGGTIALFWNLPKPFDGKLGDEIRAAYDEYAPDVDTLTTQWPLDETLDELEACAQLESVTKRVVEWVQPYTTVDYVALMGTHSNHRLMEDGARQRLQEAVGTVLDRHGGNAEVAYNTNVYLARRC